MYLKITIERLVKFDQSLTPNDILNIIKKTGHSQVIITRSLRKSNASEILAVAETITKSFQTPESTAPPMPNQSTVFYTAKTSQSSRERCSPTGSLAPKRLFH